MRELWHHLGISPMGALAVVIASACMYAVFTGVMHLWGERLRSGTSSGTIAVAALIGSICARVTLGNTPTLAGGLIALATLLLLERIFGRFLRFARTIRPARSRGSRRPE